MYWKFTVIKTKIKRYLSFQNSNFTIIFFKEYNRHLNAVETGSIGIRKAAEVTVRVREEQFTKKQAIVCVKTVI